MLTPSSEDIPISTIWRRDLAAQQTPLPTLPRTRTRTWAQPRLLIPSSQSPIASSIEAPISPIQMSEETADEMRRLFLPPETSEPSEPSQSPVASSIEAPRSPIQMSEETAAEMRRLFFPPEPSQSPTSGLNLEIPNVESPIPESKLERKQRRNGGWRYNRRRSEAASETRPETRPSLLPLGKAEKRRLEFQRRGPNPY